MHTAASLVPTPPKRKELSVRTKGPNLQNVFDSSNDGTRVRTDVPGTAWGGPTAKGESARHIPNQDMMMADRGRRVSGYNRWTTKVGCEEEDNEP